MAKRQTRKTSVSQKVTKDKKITKNTQKIDENKQNEELKINNKRTRNSAVQDQKNKTQNMSKNKSKSKKQSKNENKKQSQSKVKKQSHSKPKKQVKSKPNRQVKNKKDKNSEIVEKKQEIKNKEKQINLIKKQIKEQKDNLGVIQNKKDNNALQLKEKNTSSNIFGSINNISGSSNIFPSSSTNLFGASTSLFNSKSIFGTFKDDPIDISKKQKSIQEEQKQKQSKLKITSNYRTKSILDQLQNYSIQLDTQTQKFKIKMHSTYEIDENHKLYSSIENLYHLFIAKEKKKTQTVFLKTRYSFYPAFEFILAGENIGQHKCCICQFQFQEFKEVKDMQRELLSIEDQNIIALKCSHLLHLQCLKMLIGDKEWFKCPVCSMIYGKMIGDQPPGKMSININPNVDCDGYPGVGTITIHYSMHSGRIKDISFPGTGRTAYLPNNVEGNQVLSLLKQAFDRKLIFTIGRSVTTGRDNQIVWNGIHHKTNTSGGSAYFGYPDPTYFDRVKLQLAAKGVF